MVPGSIKRRRVEEPMATKRARRQGPAAAASASPSGAPSASSAAAAAAAGGAAAQDGPNEDEPSPHAKVLGLKDTMLKVMGIVGGGKHLFVAGVSKDWRRLYSIAHPGLKTSLPHSVFNSVECLNWAIVHSYIELRMETFVDAARWGDVSMCKALHHYGCPWDETVCEAAAQNTKKHGLGILKWLRSEGSDKKRPCPWAEGICAAAARRGDVDMLTWLLSDEANAPFCPNVWTAAALMGQINVLEMVVNHPRVRPEMEAAGEGGRWRLGAFHAAGRGQLEVLRWLHANARHLCEWTSLVCGGAVMKGKSLPTLQWLRSESVMCPWSAVSCPEELLCLGCWDGGRDDTFEEIKRWVHANGHPCDCED